MLDYGNHVLFCFVDNCKAPVTQATVLPQRRRWCSMTKPMKGRYLQFQMFIWFYRKYVFVIRSFHSHFTIILSSGIPRHTHLSLIHPLTFSVVLTYFLSLDTEIGWLFFVLFEPYSPLYKGQINSYKMLIRTRIIHRSNTIWYDRLNCKSFSHWTI